MTTTFDPKIHSGFRWDENGRLHVYEKTSGGGGHVTISEYPGPTTPPDTGPEPPPSPTPPSPDSPGGPEPSPAPEGPGMP